jgi:hypothetical protein
LALSLPDKGSPRNTSCALNLKSTLLLQWNLFNQTPEFSDIPIQCTSDTNSWSQNIFLTLFVEKTLCIPTPVTSNIRHCFTVQMLLITLS